MSRKFEIVGALVSFVLLPAGNMFAAPPNPAASIDAVTESFEANEARRQSLISRQLDLNNRMIWSSGYGPVYPGMCEPWPRVPGDIYGYRLPRPIAQPVGYESGQVGPNRWIYRPVYAVDPIYAVEASSQPAPVVGPNGWQGTPAFPARRLAPQIELPAPSDLSEPEAPRPMIGKPGIKQAGPREF